MPKKSLGSKQRQSAGASRPAFSNLGPEVPDAGSSEHAPSRPPGRPRSERARQAILDSTLELLEEGGVGRVTVEAVASRARVGKPTIYRYWSNAKELAMAALMERSGEPEPESPPKDPVLRDGSSDLGRPWHELTLQLAAVVVRFSSPVGRQAAHLLASAEPGTELAKAFRSQVILKSREESRALLESAISQDLAPASLDVDVVLDMLYGPIFFRLLSGHAALEPGVARQIVEALLDGLKPR